MVENLFSNGLKQRLIFDDCHDGLKKIPNQSVDLVLTDPHYATTKNKWDQPLNWEAIWLELRRICKPNAPIVLFSQMPFSAFLVNSNLNGYKHFWIWDKKQPGNFPVAKYMPMTVTEDIQVFCAEEEINVTEQIFTFSTDGKKVCYYPQMVKGKLRFKGSKNAKTNGQGFGGINQVYYKSDLYYPKNILSFKPVARKKSIHPSQKPVELLEYLIQTYSLEGQTVLDFTMGVGSTGVAAINTNRNFIGIEKDSNYFGAAMDRLVEVRYNKDE